MKERIHFVLVLVVISILFASCQVFAASIPLRADFPAGSAPLAIPIPLAGGIPFPKAALASVENIRLLDANHREIPCQASRLAVWPDGSVKWALIDTILTTEAGQALTLEYGPEIHRAPVLNPLTAVMNASDVMISGGGVAAAIRKNGAGILDELTLDGKTIVSKEKPARLVIETLRLANGDNNNGAALPVNNFVCRDPAAIADAEKIQIDELAIESPGPLRATVLIRGRALLPHFGLTLPDEVKKLEPAGELPFSMRVSFFKDTGVIHAQHQIIFSGEPDCDFISRWGVELPGLAGAHGALVLEPGVELELNGDTLLAAKQGTRLCYAPLKEGFALIRQGWENRPCAVTQENGSAWIDFWPRQAGLWDLRRYARDWAAGESGDTKDPAGMLRFSKYAARGIAKSQDFIICANPAKIEDDAPPLVKALSGRALLLAAPGWYAQTLALGAYAPAQTSGEFAAVDATTRRKIDYHLFCQDLYGWYGKLTYGFWQSRFGQVHRNERWDSDYGRWGWALNDGGGRIGHMLMLEFLRTLERRYFDAGEAFNRINYDTNMVHTVQHLEGSKNWWTVKGCSHRHNVQPFGDPYIGMRGSYPVGQRILYLMTGDGVIADGLEIVSDACFQYASGHGSRLGNSGDSDGQGSAANAMLWKYETSGDKKYLDACRTILDKSGLVPPKNIADLGYGPNFGLFNAAGEYAELSGDAAFQDRLVAVARLGATEKEPDQFIYAMAVGYRFGKDETVLKALDAILHKRIMANQTALEDLLPAQWPGHPGWRTPVLDPNIIRDLPYAMAALKPPPPDMLWPAPAPASKPLPASVPSDWYKAGGEQTTAETVPAAEELIQAVAKGLGGGPGPNTKQALAIGPATWTFEKSIGDRVEVNGAAPLSSAIVPFVELATPKDDNIQQAAKFEILKGEPGTLTRDAAGKILIQARAGAATFSIRIFAAKVGNGANIDGVDSLRVEAACQISKPGTRVASWGLLIPCKLGADAHAIQTTAPGAFRLERCRLDQNDERIPNWLTSEYHWGEGVPLWPKWRESGIQIGPGKSYRIWRANRADVSPLFCDQGQGPGAWFDLTDRGAQPRWGLTARVLRSTIADAEKDAGRQAIRTNLETGLLEIQFHDAAAAPLSEAESARGLCGAADLIFHEGWRAPLSKPELSAGQYEKFIDDLNYGENFGVLALRFALSINHKVKGREWAEKIRDLGIEPREILYGMQYGDGLAAHCKKLGVPWDSMDVEGSVARVIAHYKTKN